MARIIKRIAPCNDCARINCTISKQSSYLARKRKLHAPVYVGDCKPILPKLWKVPIQECMSKPIKAN